MKEMFLLWSKQKRMMCKNEDKMLLQVCDNLFCVFVLCCDAFCSNLC